MAVGHTLTSIAPPPIDPVTSDKTRWRRWARAQQATVDWPAVSSAIRGHLAVWLASRPPTTVVTYLGLGQEPDLHELSGNFGHRWATTRTPEQGPLTLHVLEATLERHRYGFLQPLATAPVVAPSDVGAVVVPGLVFDRAGTRLGHGAGYYDGLLATLHHATVLGVAPECLVVAKLPAEPHDAPMDLLVTEREISAAQLSGSSRKDRRRDERWP